MFSQLLLTPINLNDDEVETIFLYDPGTNTDLAGLGSIITLLGNAAPDNTLVNGHKALTIPTDTSGLRVVFTEPLNLQGTNWTLEWGFINTMSSTTYAAELHINSAETGLGILSRWGNAGFGNRLQFGGRWSVITDCWNPALSKSAALNKETNIALSCRNGVVTVFINGVKMNLANGTGSNYINTAYPTAADLSRLLNITAGYTGSSHNVQLGYRGRIRLSLGARYTQDYTVVPLELDQE